MEKQSLALVTETAMLQVLIQSSSGLETGGHVSRAPSERYLPINSFHIWLINLLLLFPRSKEQINNLWTLQHNWKLRGLDSSRLSSACSGSSGAVNSLLVRWIQNELSSVITKKSSSRMYSWRAFIWVGARVPNPNTLTWVLSSVNRVTQN